MDERLEKKLVEKFPIIFREYRGDPKKTCMSWGMSCGNGWFLLIYKLCRDITKLTERKNIQVIAHQVKEKFGSLRFYYGIEKKYDIFDRLNDKIIKLTTRSKLGTLHWKLIKIKRKLWPSTEDKIFDIIQEAEVNSEEFCEACGEPGTLRGGGWVYTACDKCEEKYNQGKRAWRHPEEFPDIYEELFGDSDPVG